MDLSILALIFLLSFFFSVYFLLNFSSILFFILVGGILPFFERKKLSTIQRRVGPKYVGYNGRLQFIVDALKIFFKEYIYLYFVNKNYFLLLPLITLIINLFFLINFQWFNNIFLYDIELNITFLVVLSSISNITIFLAGYSSKNKYTVITSSRTITVFFVNELLFNILITLIIYYSKSYSLNNYINFLNNSTGLFFWFALLPILVYFILAELNRVPFDFQEAESELIMGFTNEYSGFLFGAYVLIEYLHVFVFGYLFYVIVI